MGLSTDGQLTYGYAMPWDIEGTPEFLEKYVDSDEDKILDLGEAFCNMLETECKVPPFPEDFGNEDTEARDHRFAARHDAYASYPAQLITHCSYGYPMYILAVNYPGADYSASRGYPVFLGSTLIDPPAEKIEEFLTWCREHGIPCEEPPGWILSSMMR